MTGTTCFLYKIQTVRTEMLAVGLTSQEGQIIGEHFIYLQDLTAALVVLLAPGLAWFGWVRWRDGDGLEWLAQCIGISISLSALAAQIVFFLQTEFPGSDPAVLYAVCLAVAAAGWVVHPPQFQRPTGKQVMGWLAGALGGLLLIAVLVVWRLWQARGLLLPAWVNSLHHTMIVQLIGEHGGLPADLGPFLDAPFHYHYGFHLVTALFSRLSGVDAAQSVLWFGQVINALIALSVYRLARVVWKTRWQALLAALLVGFAFQMPAYYASWGRYTLSAGLVLLPLAMAQALTISRRWPSAGQVATLVVLTTGMALTHLTALLLMGFFVAVLLVEQAVKGWVGRRKAAQHNPPDTQRGTSVGMAVAALGGVSLALPWLLWMYSSYASEVQVRYISPAVDQASYWQYILYLLGPRHNYILLGLAGAALVWILAASQERALAVWGLLLGLLTLPWGLRLGPYRPDHMAIVLFLPAALLLAGALGEIARWLQKIPAAAPRRVGTVCLGLLVCAAIGWGAWNTRDVINASTVLVNQADLEAAAWIKENTPTDARFFINTMLWMNETYRGVDGGYWLALLTGRSVLVPPALYTQGEKASVEQITRQARAAAQVTTCDEAFWNLVGDAALTNVYIREGVGSLQPAGLEACPGVEPIYRRHGVFIYTVDLSSR